MKPSVFLFSDTQIKMEAFVEDLNNLLNTGEIPNLFPYDERASIFEVVRVAAKKAGRMLESPQVLIPSGTTVQLSMCSSTRISHFILPRGR